MENALYDFYSLVDSYQKTQLVNTNLPTAVSDHFLSENHSPNDIELPLEFTHSSRDALRKASVPYRKGSNS